MVDIGDQPDWLNLPDLAFNEIMMMTSLRKCMQVCSSWKERITKNILENPTKKNIIKARIESAMGPGKFPSIGVILDAKWLIGRGCCLEMKFSYSASDKFFDDFRTWAIRNNCLLNFTKDHWSVSSTNKKK